MEIQDIQKDNTANLAGKYLTFALKDEKYGIEILKVQELIGVMPMTRVPGHPDSIKGVINLRGKIIPIVDLRLKFNLEPIPYDDKTCIIVVNASIKGTELLVGIVVDTVLEVIPFNERQIEPAPNYGSHLNTETVLGLGRTSDSSVVILLDIEKGLEDQNFPKLDGLKIEEK